MTVTYAHVRARPASPAQNSDMGRDLTGDARLEFLRNSARRLKMRERIERAG